MESLAYQDQTQIRPKTQEHQTQTRDPNIQTQERDFKTQERLRAISAKHPKLKSVWGGQGLYQDFRKISIESSSLNSACGIAF